MPYRADPQCPACRTFNVVYVLQNAMPEASARFEYDCPCGEEINDALQVFEEVSDIPPGAIIATPE